MKKRKKFVDGFRCSKSRVKTVCNLSMNLVKEKREKKSQPLLRRMKFLCKQISIRRTERKCVSVVDVDRSVIESMRREKERWSRLFFFCCFSRIKSGSLIRTLKSDRIFDYLFRSNSEKRRSIFV